MVYLKAYAVCCCIADCCAAAGVKSYEHAQSAAGALGWRLTPDQVKALDDASENVQVATGLPFENW